MELRQAITERRSVRKFTEDPVSKQTIHELLELALQAPSWKNSQCWEYLVVDDPATKQFMAQSIPETNPAYKCLSTAPYVVVCIADPSKVETPQGKQYFMADAATSFYAFWLACHDAGLGTVAAGEIVDEDPLKQALGIPMEKHIYCIAPVGVPLYQPKQRPREEFNQKVSFGRYGEPFQD